MLKSVHGMLNERPNYYGTGTTRLLHLGHGDQTLNRMALGTELTRDRII